MSFRVKIFHIHGISSAATLCDIKFLHEFDIMVNSRAGAWALSTVVLCAVASSTQGASFTIDNDKFVKDGAAGFQIKAGCIHYSRVPEEYWTDRLLYEKK